MVELSNSVQARKRKLDEKKHRDKLDGLKFAPPSGSNRLNKLIAYSDLFFSQGESPNHKYVAAQLREAILKAINELHEAIASNPEEHSRKLQESYMLLRMQSRSVDESDDEFQDRLFQHTTKALPADSTKKENPWLKFSKDGYIEDACIYLSKYAFCSRIDPIHAPQDNGSLETEHASMRLAK